jgi:hypothetical protein
MFEPFPYANSDHADAPAATAAPAAAPAATAADQPAAESTKPFAYLEQNKPEPKGAPADAVPENIRALREQDSDRRMFGAQKAFADVIPIGNDWPEENKQAAAEWREILQDASLGTNEAKELVGIATSQREVPSAEVKAGWEASARAELQRVYGRDAEAVLADAMRLVQRDPRVAQFLEQTGLGSHPAYVMHAARIARQEKAKGRL